jgi:hypothetical protein
MVSRDVRDHFASQQADALKVKQHFADQARQFEAQTQPPTAFEDLMSRIQHCTDRVIGVSARLEEIGNRIYGPNEEEGALGVPACNVNPDGMLDHTLLALNWLDGALSRLERAEMRLKGV